MLHQDGATLDKPKLTIEDAFSIGPVDVKFNPDGTRVAASSIDNSLRIFSLEDDEETKMVDEGAQGGRP